MTRLGLDDDQLSSCVQCGLCLPHCPTFRATGEEVASPRGRIALMRAVERDGAPVDTTFVEAMGACVQCRGCETACPSSVPFGHLMEDVRAVLANEGSGRPPWWQRLGYRALGHHRLVLVGGSAVALAQRAHLVPRRVALPALPTSRPPLRATGDDVWLFPGCVMDAWQRRVHVAAVAVLQAMGVGAALPRARWGGGCCGALHVHAGLRPEAARLARRVMASMPGDAPILLDSAGCGAAMADYGRLLGTAEAAAFSARVVDIHTWLADHADRMPSPRRPAAEGATVAVHDACHLRHVQRAHLPVRAMLRPHVGALVELDDEGLCCGAGGAYAALHPDEAAAIRARKLAAIARSGATVVASANPGCTLHLAAAGLTVRHPIELIEESVRRG